MGLPADTDLSLLSLCNISHSFLSGHRGSNPTATVLSKTFYWKLLYHMCECSFPHSSISFSPQVSSVSLVRLEKCYIDSNAIPFFDWTIQILVRVPRDENMYSFSGMTVPSSAGCYSLHAYGQVKRHRPPSIGVRHSVHRNGVHLMGHQIFKMR